MATTATHHDHPLHRQITVTMWITRVFVILVIGACGAGLALSLAKANRVACIDDLEVAWRIDVGNGVTNLIDENTAELPTNARELEATTAQLQQVEDGERCVYRPPWPLSVVDR